MQSIRPVRQSGHRALIAGAVAAIALALPLATAAPGSAATLDKIKESSTINLGYRADARPFSFRDDAGAAAGYSVDLCQKIADQVKAELKLEKLTINWVPVTAEDRFNAVQQGKVDLLCGADSTTLTRRKDVSFSIPILPSGIGAVLRTGHPVLREVLSDVSPSRPVWRGSPARTLIEAQTFAVIAGTTSEKVLTDRINKFDLAITVIKIDSYDAGIQAVLDGTASVFFGDRLILLDAVKRSPLRGDLVVLDRLFTNEPIALGLARDDEDFRLLVDRSLSQVIASGEFPALYQKWLGVPDETAKAFFRGSALPD